MKNFFSLLALMLCCMVGITACSNNDEPGDGQGEIVTDKPIPLPKINFSPVQKAIAEKTTDFELDFCKVTDSYMEVLGENNYIISPIGAYFNLSMLANGATGETQQEILDALGFAPDDIATSNEICKMLMNSLNVNDSYSKIVLANSCWHIPDLVVQDSYKTLIADVFDAETFVSSPQTITDDFNTWCSEKAFGKIEKMLNPHGDLPLLLLSNVLYFDCKWPSPFKKLDSKLVFNNFDGTKTAVDGMENNLGVWFNVTDEYEAYFTEYGNEESLFGVVIPRNDAKYDDILADFSNWIKTDPFSESFVVAKFIMPKFSMESGVDLIPIMPQIGIKRIFDEETCELYNMIQDKSAINFFKQHNSLDVDENGTIAASATVSGTVYWFTGSPKIKVNLDRPFYFMIMEKGSKSILLSGRVNKL